MPAEPQVTEQAQTDRREKKQKGAQQTEKTEAEKTQKNREESAPKTEKNNEKNNTVEVTGVLDIHQEGFGFLRGENYLTTPNDVYVSPTQIRRFGLKTGDYICGLSRLANDGEKFNALIYVKTINGDGIDKTFKRRPFETLTPIYPDERLRLEVGGDDYSVRLIDLVAP